MILVLFAYCIAGGIHYEKIHKFTVRSLIEQPNSIFGNTPQRPRQLRGRISGVQQQGLTAFQQRWNLAESCFRKGAGSAVQKHIIFSDYRMVRNFTLIAPSASGDWRSSSIFQIRWTPPSFQWHNPAWLSLRVRTSDYRRCPNIDSFLYLILDFSWASQSTVSYESIVQNTKFLLCGYMYVHHICMGGLPTSMHSIQVHSADWIKEHTLKWPSYGESKLWSFGIF